jgi:acetoin utilization deacetylase AcuC-like enzyme
MHHGHREFGHGFCPVNDIVIAAKKLQAEHGVRSIWIIDVDAHKGDGTAALTRDDTSIVTLSVHMARGWPLDGSEILPDGQANPSFVASDIDIPVEQEENSQYLEKLAQGLEMLGQYPRPPLAIVVCGSDPYEEDELSSASALRLSLDHLLDRDQQIYHFLKRLDIPSAWLMAGGYGEHSWKVYTRFLKWALRKRMGEV